MRFSHHPHGPEAGRRHWRGDDGHRHRGFGRRCGSDEPESLEASRDYGRRNRHFGHRGRDGEHGGRRRRVFDSGELQLVLL